MSHKGGPFWVIWFTFPLALEIRNLRPRREVTQNYLAGGGRGTWVLPPVPFPAERAAHTPGSMLCSPGFSSTDPRPDREPGRGIWGLATVSIAQAERSYQPALEIPSACPWEQTDGSSPMALNALCSQSRPDREHIQRPASAAL